MQNLRLLNVARSEHRGRWRIAIAVIGKTDGGAAMSLGIQTAEALLNPRYGPLRVAIGKALYWHYRLVRRNRHDNVVLERIGDFPLLVLPGVLNPKIMRTGAFFASVLQAELIKADTDVLDMGSGSGVCAIAAARYARRVVAVDINPAAVRCTQVNALINAVEDKIEVAHGDLFAPVKGRRFDIILFNPPFIHGVPRNDADRAWRSLDVAERFAAGLTEHLKPSGFVLVLLSTYGDASGYLRQFSRWNFDISIVAERAFVNEKLTLLKLRQTPQHPKYGNTQ
jgi:HemK-related putative methylase